MIEVIELPDEELLIPIGMSLSDFYAMIGLKVFRYDNRYFLDCGVLAEKCREIYTDKLDCKTLLKKYLAHFYPEIKIREINYGEEYTKLM